MTTTSSTLSTTVADPNVEASSSRFSWHANKVLYAAVALVLAQLGFRVWVTYSTWFFGDDFIFISRTINGGTAPTELIEPHGGHVMPAGMWLSWLANEVAPYDYRVNATMLLLMQALASIGMLVLLVRMFGARPGILPPLALYLFCAITVPVAIWWAAAVNQIPLQIVLFWGLASHVKYLRTRRPVQLAVTVGWLAFGLLFYEKTILVLGAIGIVSMAYFATGSLKDRLAWMWSHYRPAVVTFIVIGVGYLAMYATYALNFSPDRAGSAALGEVVSNMVFQGYLPALVGGPVHWGHLGPFGLPEPYDWALLASLVAIGLMLREIHRSRSRSLRAWFLPAFFMGCNIVLVVAGRASFVGPLISLDFRYQGEMSAVTAVALACATMPIIGARELVERRGDSELLDHPRRVGVVTAIVVALSLVSSVQFVTNWVDKSPAKPYFSTLLGTLRSTTEPIPLVDQPMPGSLVWELVYPVNLLSHVLRPYEDKTVYRDVATDHLNVVDDKGKIVPIVVTTVRHSVPGSTEGCGHLVADQERSIPLDDPVAFGGWWVRLGYVSSARSPVVVTAGDATYGTVVEPGIHALYFEGGGAFDSVEISGLTEGVTLCTDDVIVGRATPLTDYEVAAP